MMAAALTAAAASCSDEIYSGVAGGEPVTITLSYCQPEPRDVVSTRSNATDAENALANLQVFIFSGEADETTREHKLVGYKWISSGLKQDGSVGTIDNMKALPGDCYIYGVANVQTGTSSDYSINAEGVIPTTVTEAVEAKWDVSQVTGGNNLLTLEGLQAIQFTRNAGIELTNNFIMSGAMNDGNLVRIGTSGSLTPLTTSGEDNTAADADIIKLKRLVSKITVNVTEGANKTGTDENGNTKTTEITFQPTSCKIVNIPQKGTLIEGADAVTGNNFDYTAEAEFYNSTESGATKSTYTASNIYLPENLQTASKPDEIKEWRDRERDNGGKPEGATEKDFTCAPKNGTYLVITGSYYEKTNGVVTTEATPIYYIHLGDFGENKSPKWSDFKVERNCHYTYNITITGVNSIQLEVNKEDQYQYNGAVEGIAISLQDGSHVYDLDSHYGQVNFTFDQTCVVNGTGDDDGQYFVYFFSKDIRKTSPVLKLYKEKAGDDLKFAKQTGANTWKDFDLTNDEDKEEIEAIEESIDWIELMEGIGDDKQGQAYPGMGSDKLKNLFTVISDLIDKHINNLEGTWQEPYTCFVNENYYDGKPWGEFVNTTQRYAYICRELITSHDLRSTAGAVIYGVTQKSIQTIYNTNSSIDAYGVETNVQDNYGNRSSNSQEYTGKDGRLAINIGDDRDLGYPLYAKDGWNGYANYKSTLAQAGYTTWSRLAETTEWEGRTYPQPYQTGTHSCMSRNRDLNGDGNIDDNEIRWYAPTMKQYEGLFIGQRTLSSDARLYKGNTSELKDDSYREKGYHYWANIDNSLSDYNIFWAEEGMATSAYWDSKDIVPEHFVACVRNLPAPNKVNDRDTTPQAFFAYDKESRKIDLHSELESTAYRTSFIDHELPQHYESGATSYTNKPAKSFYIAKNYTTETTTPRLTVEGDTTICANYHEDGDGGAKWRAPNLMELAIIYLALDDKDKVTEDKNSVNSFCRTKFSNDSFRYTWGFGIDNNGKVLLRMIGKSGEWPNPDSGGYYLRCVRDTPPSEINE